MTARLTSFIFIFICFIYTMCLHAQSPAAMAKINHPQGDIFGTGSVFIENVGQCGDTLAGYGYMGKIISSYEGFGNPVLFTKKGLIYVQREFKLRTRQEIEKEERRAKRKGEKPSKDLFRENIVTMEWVNQNPATEILFENISTTTHSYALITKPARGFSKLLYKNVYPGIDAIFSFIENKSQGFEYQLIVQPGADPSLIKMKYGGDISRLEKDQKGNLLIRSAVSTIMQTSPLAFSGEKDAAEKTGVSFSMGKKLIGFNLSGYDKTKLLTIDPFVSSTSNLTGANIQKAKDIDFDYEGNVYVSGGGNSSVQMLAKFSPGGVLLWTFSGSLTVPAWNFGGSYGGWVVDKTSGSVYLGQGLAGSFRIVRLNSSGVYDNYITTANPNFSENWKMIYSCRSGIGTILAAGGGGNANNELALIAPPDVNPGASNISGLTGGHNDISDIVLDPLNDDMYTIFSTSVNTPNGDNIIYKHSPPFTVSSLAWTSPTGLFVLKEPNNRPYMQGLDNSSNTLAVNANYLFYWDGVNLKAFNKTTGAAAGSVFTVPGNIKLQQGGIYADECNNVFVGSSGGVIKAFKFDGNAFNDNAVTDLNMGTGFTGSVYDLAYDNGKKALYASGDGFVASFDLSAYCPTQVYEVKVIIDCVNGKVTANINPAPGPSTAVTYSLYSGSTLIATNATGVFTGVAPGSYTMVAYLNQACGGPHTETNFTITAAPNLIITDPPLVCQPATADLTSPAITAGSSSGMTLTYWTDAAATVSFATPSTAPAGTYYIKAESASGCFSIAPVNVISKPSPVADAGPDQTICFQASTQLQGSGGGTYQWTPSNYLSNASISNPFVTGAPPGNHRYTLTVTNADGCKNIVTETVTITVQPKAILYLPPDTAIIANQPLQLNPIDLNGVGMTNFNWTPSTGLNNTQIKDPIAIIDRNMLYVVTAMTAANCPTSAQIKVIVFKQADIYVPTAFTPDRDGLNDVLKALPVGIKTFKYFRIYNRGGSLIFSTTDPRKGWDGKIGGLEQGSGVFIYTAEGIDLTGKTLFRKGTTTIIR